MPLRPATAIVLDFFSGTTTAPARSALTVDIEGSAGLPLRLPGPREHTPRGPAPPSFSDCFIRSKEKANLISQTGLYLCRQRPEFILSLPKDSHTLGAC